MDGRQGFCFTFPPWSWKRVTFRWFAIYPKLRGGYYSVYLSSINLLVLNLEAKPPNGSETDYRDQTWWMHYPIHPSRRWTNNLAWKPPIGTSSIVHEVTHHPLLSTLSAIVETVVHLRALGHKVVLVSSGAIGVGLKRMEMPTKPKSLSGKQVCYYRNVIEFNGFIWIPMCRL